VNLPNALTISRIVAAPLVALLPLAPTWELRFAAFWLFIAVAITDYWDGKLARSRNLVTDLGRLLDPLADKLLLVATFVPMFLLGGTGWEAGFRLGAGTPVMPGISGPLWADGGDRMLFPFYTPLGAVMMPWWVFAIILGREALMTVFRQAAARRGVVIGAIGPAKLKTVFQWIWVGAGYFWFAAATAAVRFGWSSPLWEGFALLNGSVAVFSMSIAVLLTLWSMYLYIRRYGSVLRQ
jgi:CDP-diacylglycerol--glycerol-3-phosphate 3-phosphatidyltransferase